MNSQKSVYQRELLLEYFGFAIHRIGDMIVSSLLYRKENMLRCFISKMGWQNCDSDIVELYNTEQQSKKNVLKQNEYFGTYNEKKFCLVKSNFSDDKRFENKGKVCTEWSKPVLIHIILNILKMPIEIIDQKKWDSINSIMDRAKLIKLLLENSYVKKCEYITDNQGKGNWSQTDFEYYELDDNYSNDYLKSFLFYAKITRPMLCGLIKNWFSLNNILTYDANCGTANKKT